jgi:hypothetical protein
MSHAELIERLERILPGLQNSSSSAEDAMIRALPEVIAALAHAAKLEAALQPVADLCNWLGNPADETQEIGIAMGVVANAHAVLKGVAS